jgi:hypothetical protein
MLKQDGLIDLPFRILPSRSKNTTAQLGMIAIGVVLFAAGIWDAVDPPEGFASGIMLIFGLILVATCSFWFFRERRYFDPRNEYWIEIGLEEFALVTPDATDRSAWASLSAFEVKQTTHRHKTKLGEYETYSYDAIALYGGLEVKIPLGDFATALANDDSGRAKAMCAILNELRQNALNRQADKAGEPFHVPPGLVVAPMPAAKRKPLIVSNSVVQRS